MPVIPLDDPQDARLDWYRNVRDRVLRRADDRFILEGRTILERFLDAGHADRVESVLVETDRGPAAGHPATRGLFAKLPDRVSIYVMDPALMAAVTGMKTHTGVLAIARRPDPIALDDLIAPPEPADTAADPPRHDLSGGGNGSAGRPLFVVAHAIKETVNLGALMRVCAAFDVRGLILGPHCCDPFYRRAVRVSMGVAFRLPIHRSDDLRRDLTRLRDAFGVQLAALELTDDADALPHADLPPAPTPLALLLGHEVTGLPDDLLDLADARLMIPMAPAVDSLNVFVSAAVLLYHLRFIAGERAADPSDRP